MPPPQSQTATISYDDAARTKTTVVTSADARATSTETFDSNGNPIRSHGVVRTNLGGRELVTTTDITYLTQTSRVCK